MDISQYSGDFYSERHGKTALAAARVIDLLLDIMPMPASAVDVGCGVGTWLADLKGRGVDRIQGYEGEWLDTAQAVVPKGLISLQDLARSLPKPTERFDLAISLEVAEHLPEAAADDFVASLVNLSDIVLFSAAIPGQGGKHHVNEQWLEYWVGKFESRGYVGLDVIRRHIWQNSEIAEWYRQNIVVFVNKDVLPRLTLPAAPERLAPVSLVHPATFSDRLAVKQREIDKQRTVSGAWKTLRRALAGRYSQR